ncbi:MAG: acyltransferase family protein [Thermoleophilaceae bacterium]
MGREPATTPPGAPNGAAAQKKSFRADIQGIRCLGLAIVFLTHAEVDAVPGGFVGLDAFFVLSGFLITGLILAEMDRTGTVSLMKFYARRIRRLLPLAMFVLFAVVIASAVMFSPVRNDAVAGDVIAAAFYFVNWRFAAQSVDYFAANALESPIQHFWTLSVEEQFYLVWPALLLLAFVWWSRNRRGSLRAKLWLVVLLTGVPSLYYSAFVVDDGGASYSYFSTLSRVWEFSLGGALALALPKELKLPGPVVAVLSWVGVGTLIVTAMIFTPELNYPGTAALAPTLATAAIVIAGTTAIAPKPTRMLASKPFQYIGDLSYSWYLWHWPAIVFAREAWGELSSLELIGVIAASWVPAHISHKLIEQPFRYSRPLARRPRRALAFGFASMAIAVAMAVSLTGLQPTVRTASAGQAIGAAAALEGEALQSSAQALQPQPREAKDDRGQLYEDGCLVEQTETESPECVYGRRSSDKRVVLFGNSHAFHYAPAMMRLARKRSWRLTALLRAGCPIGDVRFAHRCDVWREHALARIEEREEPDLIVVATTTELATGVVEDGERLDLEDSRDALHEGLVRTLDRLRETGARVVLMADLPRSSEDVPDCVSRELDALERCAFPDERDRETRFDARAADRLDGVEKIDPTPLLCPRRLCPAVMGNTLVYRDTNHFTATFARTLAPWLDRRLPVADANG